MINIHFVWWGDRSRGCQKKSDVFDGTHKKHWVGRKIRIFLWVKFLFLGVVKSRLPISDQVSLGSRLCFNDLIELLSIGG